MLLTLLVLISLSNFLQFPLGECSIVSGIVSGRVSAMYVFGDSLNDNGNTVLVKFYPYGSNFPDGPTGRWTNGKIFPDYVAEYLGLPYPPPYRTSNSTSEVGYNYATGGCGILPESGTNCWSMDKQMEFFKETITKELVPKFEEKVYEHLANSIFIVWVGSNDYLLNYFLDKNPELNPEDFAQLLIAQLSDKLQVLYDLGARKVLVMELPPLGCIPMSKRADAKLKCDEFKNQNAILFNNKLASSLQTMASTLPHSLFTLGKIYHGTDDAFKNPEKYGFTNVVKPCCFVLFGAVCIPSIPPCKNPDEYLFWDAAHPSQASISIMASQCFDGSSVCVPLNIKQLALAKAKPAVAISLRAAV